MRHDIRYAEVRADARLPSSNGVDIAATTSGASHRAKPRHRRAREDRLRVLLVKEGGPDGVEHDATQFSASEISELEAYVLFRNPLYSVAS